MGGLPVRINVGYAIVGLGIGSVLGQWGASISVSGAIMSSLASLAVVGGNYLIYSSKRQAR